MGCLFECIEISKTVKTLTAVQHSYSSNSQKSAEFIKLCLCTEHREAQDVVRQCPLYTDTIS